MHLVIALHLLSIINNELRSDKRGSAEEHVLPQGLLGQRTHCQNHSYQHRCLCKGEPNQCMWKLVFIPEEWMVKHFSRERYNLQEKRYHTLLTSTFSHTGIFSLGIDLLLLGYMGRFIQTNIGNRYLWWLYGMGALFGGITHAVFQPPSPYIQPDVGPTSVITSYLTFLAMLNPQQPFVLLGFPIKAWVLVASLGAYSLFTDPCKQSFSGISAGMLVFTLMRVGML